MTIGIIGLGLIGGSLAKALSKTHRILGYDIQNGVIARAIAENSIHAALERPMLSECDICIIALYPEAAENFLKTHASDFRKNAIVTDCTGVKREICRLGESLARENGFIFVGGHPMAGKEYSGYEAADGTLFKDSSMILVTPENCPDGIAETLTDLFAAAGFSTVKFTTAQEHDRIIAFTSQLAHIVSNAYIRSASSEKHMGFSAGSYKDLTRVAYLNEEMWTQLFLSNKDCLLEELDGLIERLGEYSAALHESDAARLSALLRDGREKKIKVDGGAG